MPYRHIRRAALFLFIDCFRSSFGTTGGAPLFIDALPH
nr:MAG TPA: hypothetical protein [Caudoviricetes sp.]